MPLTGASGHCRDAFEKWTLQQWFETMACIGAVQQAPMPGYGLSHNQLGWSNSSKKRTKITKWKRTKRNENTIGKVMKIAAEISTFSLKCFGGLGLKEIYTELPSNMKFPSSDCEQ